MSTTTFKQREDRRVFQKYLTKLLYNNTNIPINDVCNKLSADLWKYIVDNVYSMFLRSHTPSFLERLGSDFARNQYVWETYCRFYLKGNKATLQWIKEQIKQHDKQNDEMYRVLLEIIYKSVVHFESDSDFDFSLVLHPDQMQYEEEGRMVHYSLVDCMQHLRNNLQRLFTQEYIREFIDTANSLVIQQKCNLLKSLQDIDVSVLNNVQLQQLQTCINKLRQGQPLSFVFKGAQDSSLDFEHPIDTGVDEFLLYRLFLNCKCTDAPDLFPKKQFAECIDVSMSLNGPYNLELWKHSSLDEMEVPIQYLYDEYQEHENAGMTRMTGWKFPIVSLNYQLHDATAMFEEDSPSKPDKRCERFIDQMRIFCVKEKIPNLPNEITVSAPVYRTISDPANSCYDLNQVFAVKEVLPSGFVKMVPKPQFMTLVNFEGWCRTQKYRNTSYPVGYSSACNRPFRSKNQLVLDIRDLFGANGIPIDSIDWVKVLERPKQQICLFFKEAEFVLRLIKIFVEFMKQNRLTIFVHRPDMKRLAVVSQELFNAIHDELPNANLENNVYSDLVLDFIGDSEDVLDRFEELIKQLTRDYLRRMISSHHFSDSLLTFISMRIGNNNFRQMLLNSTFDS